MSLLWKTATQREPLHFAQQWAGEYPMSPVAHPEVTSLIRQFPPAVMGPGDQRSEADIHGMYSKMMNNVVHHHAAEWFKGDPEGHHETTHNMTQNYLDAHNGHSPMEGLL